MIDLGIYLLEHVDLASLVVVLGLVLDYVATQPLKSEALAWVRAGRFAVSLKHFLTGFLSVRLIMIAFDFKLLRVAG